MRTVEEAAQAEEQHRGGGGEVDSVQGGAKWPLQVGGSGRAGHGRPIGSGTLRQRLRSKRGAVGRAGRRECVAGSWRRRWQLGGRGQAVGSPLHAPCRQARRQGCVGESAPVRTPPRSRCWSLAALGADHSPASPLIFASSAAQQPQQGRLPPPCIAGRTRHRPCAAEPPATPWGRRRAPNGPASGSEVTPTAP